MNTRDGWTETTLGDIAEVVGGGTPSTAKEEFWDGELIWLTPTEVTAIDGKVISDSKRKITQAGLRSSGARILPQGTVILTSRASVGFVALAGTELTTNQGFQSLIPSELVDGVFLMFWIQMNRSEFESRAAGSTFKEISKSNVKSISMNLPPLVEQRRIVDVVSSVDAYIDALQQQADTARTARDAVLHELLSAGGDDWTETTIGSRCVVKGGKRLPKGTPWAVNPTAHPYIRATDFRGGQIDTSNLVYVPDDVWPVVSRYVVQAGDVLITIAGTIGAVALTPDTHIGANLTENAALIRPMDETLNSHFLHLWLMSDTAQRQITDLTIGTTQQKLGLFRIESIEIQLPPIDEQKRIVEVISSMDEVIQATEQTVADVKILRTGLLSDLLSGEHEIPESYDVLVGAA